MRVDPVSLASGALVALIGSLVLIESAGALDISLGWTAVALTAAVGTILVLAGLVGGAERHD